MIDTGVRPPTTTIGLHCLPSSNVDSMAWLPRDPLHDSQEHWNFVSQIGFRQMVKLLPPTQECGSLDTSILDSGALAIKP